MPDLALPVLFTAAVFLTALVPLLYLTRQTGGEDDTLPWADEPVRFDHPLTLDRIWHTFGFADGLR